MVKMKMLAVLQLKKYILLHLFVRVKNNVWPLVHQFDWIIPREKKNETNKTSANILPKTGTRQWNQPTCHKTGSGQ